jgi:hypothetical protein
MKFSRRTALATVSVLAVVLSAGATQAQFLMSGSVTLNAGFSTTRIIPGGAQVVGTPGSLMIPAQAFKSSGTTFRTFPTIPMVAQALSTHTSSNAATTLNAAGGPAAFEWCPRNVFDCTAPNNATLGFNGLLEYRNGGGFGGTFIVLRQTVGSVSRLASPSSYSHAPGGTNNPWIAGQGFQVTQSGGQATPVTTSNPLIGSQGSIQTVGPIVGTGTPPPTAFETGFPATTGQIHAIDSVGSGTNTFTITGSDARNANGHGNITLRAAGYSNNLSTESFPRFLNLQMTLAPPVPSMGAPGIASLGALILIGGGFALRKRL